MTIIDLNLNIKRTLVWVLCLNIWDASQIGNSHSKITPDQEDYKLHLFISWFKYGTVWFDNILKVLIYASCKVKRLCTYSGHYSLY